MTTVNVGAEVFGPPSLANAIAAQTALPVLGYVASKHADSGWLAAFKQGLTELGASEWSSLAI